MTLVQRLQQFLIFRRNKENLSLLLKTIFFTLDLALLYFLFLFQNAARFVRKSSATDKSLKPFQEPGPTKLENQMPDLTIQKTG